MISLMHGKERLKKKLTQRKRDSVVLTSSCSDGIPPNREGVPDDDYLQKSLEKWTAMIVKFSERKKTSVWERAGILPRFVRALYESVENRYGVHITEDDKKLYYSKFMNKASGSATLTSSEMEQLLGPSDLDLAISMEEARSQIQLVLTRHCAAIDAVEDIECDADRLDFEVFISVVCEFQKQAFRPAEPSRKSCRAMLSHLLPIDPDSTMKQSWDIFCLVLLFYCSFSVPYGIAFLDADATTLSVLDMFGLAVDIIFMCDILLSFVTSIEVDGVVVRNLRVISATYARWSNRPSAGSPPSPYAFSLCRSLALRSSRTAAK